MSTLFSSCVLSRTGLRSFLLASLIKLIATMTMAMATTMTPSAQAAQAPSGATVRIAYIDPISGSFANVGINILRVWKTLALEPNVAGVHYEIVPFDNKASPQGSLSALQAAIDQGFTVIVQGQGSGAAAALSDAVAKHNARDPDKAVLYLNYAAVDPALTNERCNFWHFRFDADTATKMEAMAVAITPDQAVHRVFFINQNYAHGQQVNHYGKAALARRRPDIQVVGEELHPLGQVKDFAPYIAKIKASGADTVITGNWGSDLSLLFKAARDAGLDVNWYTYYAVASGAPTALGHFGEGKVHAVYIHHPNLPSTRKTLDAFKAQYHEEMSTLAISHALKMLSAAIEKAQSTDSLKIAKALEGLSVKSFDGEITMRARDHQLQQKIYSLVWQQRSPKYDYDVEQTGMTWGVDRVIAPDESATPSTCQMSRP